MLVLVISFIVAVPLVSGLVISQRQRNIDRRRFFAFVGYVAGAVALTAILVGFLVVQRPYPGTTRQVFTAIVGCIILISWLVMILAGLFSKGVHRSLLLLYGIMMAFDYLLIAAGNFGD